MSLIRHRPFFLEEVHTKTVGIISDTHCGSVYGLTPPKYFSQFHKKLQIEGWNAYQRIVNKWHKPKILIANGDLIEGTQSKQGGAELITSDRNVQCNMAVDCLEAWNAEEYYLTYGSKYHVGEQAEDFEYQIAERLRDRGHKVIIEGRLYLKVEGMILDVRHKIGTSNVPHGRATALLKEMMWDLMEEAEGLAPKVKVVIRSHAHYHILVEDPSRTMIITPGLQFKRGRFGTRECQGRIDWGAMRLTLDKGEIIRKEKDICRLIANKPKVYRIK